MKKGDLVRFSTFFLLTDKVRGRIGIVLDVRKNLFGMWEDDVEFDVLMDGEVIKDILGGEEIEVISAEVGMKAAKERRKQDQ